MRNLFGSLCHKALITLAVFVVGVLGVRQTVAQTTDSVTIISFDPPAGSTLTAGSWDSLVPGLFNSNHGVKANLSYSLNSRDEASIYVTPESSNPEINGSLYREVQIVRIMRGNGTVSVVFDVWPDMTMPFPIITDQVRIIMKNDSHPFDIFFEKYEGATFTWLLPPSTISVSPFSLEFGSVTVGSSRDMSFSITSIYTYPLEIFMRVVASPVFSILPQEGLFSPGDDYFNLAPDQSLTVIVRFSPTTTGYFGGGSVNIGTASAFATIDLSGTGVIDGCNYSISPTSQSFGSSGGTGSVSVTAQSGCPWTATSKAGIGWITITSGSSGNGNGMVSYTVAPNTNTSSRTDTLTIAGQTFTVTQDGTPAQPNQPPTITNFIANPTTVDPGRTSAISVAASDPEGDPLTYTWSASGGTLSASSGPGPVTWTAPSSSGTFSVTVNVTDNKADHTSVSASVSITVVMSLSVSCSASPNPANSGQTVTWTASPSGGTGSYSYSWSGDDGLSGTTQSVSKTYTNSSSSQVTKSATVTVTSASQSVSNSCSVTINSSLPEVPVNNPLVPTAPPLITTAGTPGTTQITVSDPDAGQTHTFVITAQPSNGTATVSATGLVSYTPNSGFSGSDSLLVTVTDNGSPPLSGAVTINVIVNPLPVTLVSISVTPTSITMNVGQTQQFTATGRFSDGSTRNMTMDVGWSISNPSIGSISTSGFFTALKVGTVEVFASNSGIKSNIVIVTVTSPQPDWTITLSASVTNVTIGSSVRITATTNRDVGGTPFAILIFEGSTMLGGCSLGTQCSVIVSETSPTRKTYVAKIAERDGSDVQATSNTVSVTWGEAEKPTGVSEVSLIGTVPEFFTTNGGTFKVSISPKDENGNLITSGVTIETFSFKDVTAVKEIAAALATSLGTVITQGEADATKVDIIQPGSGEEVTVVLDFDSSGSMKTNDPARLRVDAGKQFIGLLKPQDLAAIMDFGPKPTPGMRASRLLQDFTSDKALLEKAIDRVTATGSTPLFESLLDALDLLAEISPANPAVVGLTDGKANSDAKFEDVIKQANVQSTPIFPIGLGKDINFSQLQELAKRTGGTFAEASGANALNTIFESMGFGVIEGRVVVTAEGMFEPPLPGPGQYVVSGVLVTTIDGVSVDTLFGFPVEVADEDLISNVVFVPGIMGSRLYVPQPSSTLLPYSIRWEPRLSRVNQDVLELQPDDNGDSMQLIVTYDSGDRGIIDCAYSACSFFVVYRDIIRNLDDLLGHDRWAAVPYDWRLSIDTQVNGVIAAVNAQLEKNSPAKSPTGKVSIIAHSMGALLAKEYFRIQGTDKVDKFIMVASPQLGTPDTLSVLLHGNKDLGIPFLNESTLRTAVSTMHGVHILLPSEKYFQGVRSGALPPVIQVQEEPAASVTGFAATDYSAFRSFLIGKNRPKGLVASDEEDTHLPTILNEDFLEVAEFFHNERLDNWVPPRGLKTYQIIGNCLSTPSSLNYFVDPLVAPFPTFNYQILGTDQGDGTVLTWSATATRAGGVRTFFVNLRDYNLSNATAFSHGDILAAPPVIDLINGLLLDTVKAFPSFVTETTARTQNCP